MKVYLVRNTINGKVYVGKTVESTGSRWVKHVSAAKHGSRTYIHKAIRKYGAEVFVVEELASADSNEQLSILEQQFIKQFESSKSEYGYNLTLGGEGITGWSHSEETKRKIGIANKGGVRDEQLRARISQKLTGRKLSASHRSKLVGQVVTEEVRARISSKLLGHKVSDETRRKISESHKKRRVKV
jgi:group I intron endonuclease